MPKYKIVTGEPVSEPDSDAIVEVRLIMDDDYPSIEARNPSGPWHPIAFFSSDGRLATQVGGGDVYGLKAAKNSMIEVW